MTRTIQIDLPPEPEPLSVVLVQVEHGVASGVTTPRAMQRFGDGFEGRWHLADGESPGRRGWSWAEVIAMADGREILVLWEPS